MGIKQVKQQVKQYDIFTVSLDPTVGAEIKKSRPCLIISPNEMNKYISTVIIAPMTTQSHSYPSRVSVEFQGKQGWIILDQIRTVDKKKLVKKLGEIEIQTIKNVKNVLKEILVD